jgi:hypothetical protein
MRKLILDWLLSATALRAWLQLALAIPVGVLYHHVLQWPGPQYIFLRAAAGFIFLVLLIGPVYYFIGPPLFFGLGLLLARFSKTKPEYPCPVCGYDIRATPHRCPECGTKLRWGQLVK